MRLREKFEKEIIPIMQKEFGYKNHLAVPRVEKVVVNVGFGRLVVEKPKEEQEKIKKEIAQTLSQITGQKPVFCPAKKSISAFKTREGLAIGAKVTLRKQRMYDFLEKLINVVFPRVRDFKGLNPSSFDPQGNFSFGFSDQMVFPEILPEQVKIPFGLQITIVIKGARTKDEAIALLTHMGFPFKK